MSDLPLPPPPVPQFPLPPPDLPKAASVPLPPLKAPDSSDTFLLGPNPQDEFEIQERLGKG
jgi:hypothetical protein